MSGNVNFLEQFRVAPDTKVDLKKIDPSFKDRHESQEEAANEIARHQQRLRELQELLYVSRTCSLLICLQAMDTGGKDGIIRHVLSAMNPQGCRVTSFKQPTARELAHDFLWRIHRAVPANGEVAIFNRSHYEDVLVVRVHKLVPKKVWSQRYEHINAFEKNLSEQGTHILKFFLHISKDEQL